MLVTLALGATAYAVTRWLSDVIENLAPTAPFPWRNETSRHLQAFFESCTGAPLNATLETQLEDHVSATAQVTEIAYGKTLREVPPGDWMDGVMNGLPCPSRGNQGAEDYATQVLVSFFLQVQQAIRAHNGNAGAAPALRDAMAGVIVMTTLHLMGLI